MRRLAALGIALLVAVLAAPTPAIAGPAPALCTPNNARGGVPADFVLDACATARTITVFNNLATPVMIRPAGSLGPARRVQERRGPAAAVLRKLAPTGVLLLPGDVARWPLGPGAAWLDASALEPTAAAAVVDDIAQYLPRLGDSKARAVDYAAAFAGVVTDIADAVQTRTACAEGVNFLQTEACDVTAASAIGRSTVVQLPQRTAYNMLSVVLETDNWTAWANAGAPLTGSMRLVQAARGRAVPARAAPVAPAATAGKVTPAASHGSPPARPASHAPAAAPAAATAAAAAHRPTAAPRPPAAPRPKAAPRTWRDVLADLVARAQASKAQHANKSSERAKGKGGRGHED